MIVIFSQNILGILLLSLASSAALKNQLLNSFEDNVFFFFLFLRSLAMKYVCNVWIKKKKNKKKKSPDPSWACVFSLSSTIPIGILMSSMSLKSLLAYPTVLFHIASLVLSSNSLIVFYTSLNIITNPE